MIEALSYDVPLIAAQYADRFFKFLSDKGISKEVIQAHNPESKEIANHNYLSMNQLVPVLETAQSLLNDEKAAFEFGQQLDLFAHGLFGYALLSTDDYPQRIETIVKHLQISLPLFEMRFEQAGKDISIQLHDTWELGDARGFIAKVYFGSIYTIAASICENLKFDFDFGTELSGTDWETLAPDTLWHFNATNNEITLKQVKQLEKDESEKKVVTLRQQQVRQQPESLNNENRTYASRVREHVRKSTKTASIERSAALLGISSRYLRQCLSNEGTSFREISNEIRQNYADLYLCKTHMPLTDIATRLGFGDQASFTRAYKSWTGMTPGEARKRGRNAAAEI